MKINLGSGSRISVNGRSYNNAKSVSVINGKVVVDGVVQGTEDGSLAINIEVHGDVEYLENECGDVRCNNVGNVSTVSGDVECNNVNGSINSVSGDVRCGRVAGSISTVSGDIKNQ